MLKSYFLLFLLISNILFSCAGTQVVSTQLSNTSLPDSGITFPDVNHLELPALPPLPAPEDLQLQFPANSGATIQPLRERQPAAFNGVLFNGAALAYIEVEFRAIQQRCMIDRRRETQEIIARYQAQLERIQVSLDSTRSQHQIIVGSRDREIQSLNRIITQQQSMSTGNTLTTILYVGGGALFGFLLAAGGAFAISR